MNIVQFSDNINDYLSYDNIIDYKEDIVTKLAKLTPSQTLRSDEGVAPYWA